MNKFLTAILLAISFASFGQIEITIPDTKGDAESFDKLTDKKIISDLSSFTITASINDAPKVKALPEIPIFSFSDTSAIFKKDSLKIEITSTRFDTTGHKLKFADNSNHLLLIDNNPIWGTDGNIPKRKIKSVILTFGKQKITLPKSAITSLYEPNFCWLDKSTKRVECRCSVYQSADKRRIYVYMLNSDGAGGYELTWIFQDNKYLKRVVDYGF